MLVLESAGITFGRTYSWWLTGLNFLGVLALMFWLDRKRVIVGSGWKQARPQQVR
jgi:hypothetical protein